MAAQLEIEISAITDKLKKGVDGAVLSLGQLEKEALGINRALENATDPRDIVRLNNALEQTKAAMVNLRTAGLQPLTRAQSNYNSVGVDFARIIQDAPFGIIGVGNNITQLAGSFQNLRNQSTSTTAALKTAFASIISPTNLLVLGISTVTTALTLYAQSARGAKGPVDDLKEAQDNFNDSLKETDRLLGREVFSQFLNEVGLVERKNVGGKLIDVPTFESAIEVVNKLSDKIQNLRKGELDLLAKFLNTEISEALRVVANNSNSLAVSLAQQDLSLYQGLLDKVNVQLSFYKNNTESSSKATKDLNKELEKVKRSFEDISKLPSIGLPRTGDVEALRARFKQLREGGQVQLTPEQLLQQAIKNAPGVNLENTALNGIQKVTESLDNQLLKVSELSNAFAGLGTLIGSAFKNPQLGSFLGQFASFAAKLIATNFKIAASSAVAGASASAAGTGPAAVFTLPAFIATAVGLVAGAFAAFGGGGSSRGVGGSVAQSQTFGGTGAFNNPNDFFSNVVFEIEGTRLVGVLQRTNDKYASG